MRIPTRTFVDEETLMRFRGALVDGHEMLTVTLESRSGDGQAVAIDMERHVIAELVAELAAALA